MKKLFTAILFASGALLFACEDPSEEAFAEVDQVLIEVDDSESLEEVSGTDIDLKMETD